MNFSFKQPKPVPVFTSRSEAFDYMLSELVAKGTDMMDAAEKAAKFAGIHTDRTKFLIYLLAGAITGFAAFINVIKVGSVTASGGNQLETQILIALVLGGMPISGGAKARFMNVIVGSLLYIVLTSGLIMMGLTTQAMQLIQGVVFLVFVAIFADRESLKVIK
jgi:ribose transport system permease protein